MKGVVVAKAGAPFEVVETLTKPSPGPSEILVKSLVAGMNPMENFMQQGLLVEDWPIVLGCDTSGVVAEVGKDVTSFKVGDAVFGPVRVGFVGYMAFQEYFLMETRYAFKKPATLSTEHAAASGIASLTATLGLVTGLGLEIPKKALKEKDEWLVILGGAAAIGQFAIQIAKLNGYKIIASCSPSNDELVLSTGADATFNYKNDLPTQLNEIKSITGGNFSKVFDPSAASSDTAFAALQQVSTSKEKHFTSTNDWLELEAPADIKMYRIHLGQLGRSGTALADEVSREVTRFIPALQGLFASGDLQPLDFVVGGEGFEGVVKALAVMNEGKARGKKVVVRLQYE